MTLVEACKALFQFQYKSIGYGKFTCVSCGSLKIKDWDEKGNLHEKIESCSKTCPWKIVKDMVSLLEL